MNIDIKEFLQKYISSDEKFILACSTGPDSMFLLYEILKTEYKKNVVIAYFNHKIRPEADEEEQYIRELGKKEGFEVEIGSVDIRNIQGKYPSRSLEELAREKRYEFFDTLLRIHSVKYIMTGHHLDDRIETFFFNLVRGSKLTGLINMTETSPSPTRRGLKWGILLRPLLSIEKTKILQYLDTHHLKYFIDSTNTDTNITRNKLRVDVLPQFSEINTNYKGNIENLLQYFEELKAHIDAEVRNFLFPSIIPAYAKICEGEKIELWNNKLLHSQQWGNSFSISEFQSLSPLLQKEVITHIYYISNWNSTIGLSEWNIAEIIRFIGGKNNKTVKEIHYLKMRKENTRIEF